MPVPPGGFLHPCASHHCRLPHVRPNKVNFVTLHPRARSTLAPFRLFSSTLHPPALQAAPLCPRHARQHGVRHAQHACSGPARGIRGERSGKQEPPEAQADAHAYVFARREPRGVAPGTCATRRDARRATRRMPQTRAPNFFQSFHRRPKQRDCVGRDDQFARPRGSRGALNLP